MKNLTICLCNVHHSDYQPAYIAPENYNEMSFEGNLWQENQYFCQKIYEITVYLFSSCNITNSKEIHFYESGSEMPNRRIT